jgi:hypothetical protein
MAQTITQSDGDGVSRVATGRYLDTGTVAAYTVTVGFTPKYVGVFNVTSGDQMQWFEGMTSGHALKQVTAGTSSILTSNGISVSGNTFTIGLDTDVNVTSEQISWIAIG